MPTCWYCDRPIRAKKDATREDDELHKSCDAEIARNSDPRTLMERAEAASMWVNRVRGGNRVEGVLAFLSIFHPRMPLRRRAEIARGIERDR